MLFLTAARQALDDSTGGGPAELGPKGPISKAVHFNQLHRNMKQGCSTMISKSGAEE